MINLNSDTAFKKKKETKRLVDLIKLKQELKYLVQEEEKKERIHKKVLMIFEFM